MSHFFQDAREVFSKSVRAMTAKVKENLASWAITTEERMLLRWIIGDYFRRRFPSNRASNLTTRGHAASELRFVVRRMILDDPSYRFRHLTIVHNGWRTLDRATNVELEAVKRTVGQLMASSGLDGWVGVVEIQAEAKAKRGLGRDLMPHAHLLVWTRDAGFDFNALEKALAASKRLKCPPGAETVVITGDELIEPRDVRTWIWYMFKAPHIAKNPVPKKANPAEHRYYGADIRPNLAVRLMEVLSMMELTELIMGSGEGRQIANQLKASIRAYARKGDLHCHPNDILNFWARARKRSGKAAYTPVVINRWRSNKRTAAYIRGPYRKSSEKAVDRTEPDG